MKAVRTTLIYALVLILLLAGIGGWYAYQQWANRGELIREQILTRAPQLAPHWDVQIGKCSFDFLQRIRLENVSVKAKSQPFPAVVLPQVVISLDTSAFLDAGAIRIIKIRLVRPNLALTQNREGQWNWEQLLPWPETSGGSLPECEIEQANVTVHRLAPDNGQSTPIVLSDVTLSLVPSGKRRFWIKGDVSVAALGRLTLDGRWDVDTGTGTINGEMPELALNRDLMQLASQMVPPLQERIASCRQFLGDRLRERGQPETAVPYRRASDSRGLLDASNAVSTRTIPPDPPIDTREVRTDLNAAWSQPIRTEAASDFPVDMSAVGHVFFRISRLTRESEPEFKVLVELLRGEMRSDLIPYAATKLSGKLYCDNQTFVVRDVEVGDGSMELTLQGEVPWCQSDSPADFSVSVSNLACDERLRSQFSAGLRGVYDILRPTGYVDATVKFLRNANGQWQPCDLAVTAKNGSILHTKFPYPIDNIHGTIIQQGTSASLKIQATGSAGGQPVTLAGYVHHPGPQAESRFDVHVRGLAVDRTFLHACKPEIQQTITALNLEGNLDVDLTLVKAPEHASFVPQYDVRLMHGSLQYERFPYRIEEVNGKVTYSDHVWAFESVNGVHNRARLQASGYFAKEREAGPGRLHLTVAAQDLPFEESLRLALPPSLQSTWNQLSPSGRVNLTTILDWSQDGSLQIALNDIEVFEGRIEVAAFPYAIQQIHATGWFQQGDLRVTAFRGVHGDTEITCQGVVKTDARGDWTMRCEELTVKDLVPDNEFRRALPPAVRQIFECLHPERKIAMRGMLELRGTQRPVDPVTAAWDLEMELVKGAVTVGLGYEDVMGTVRAKGIWNGYEPEVFDGRIDVREAKVLGHRLTDIQGPFYVKDGMLVVGARDALLPASNAPGQPAKASAEHVTAKAIDGVLTLDAVSTLEDDPTYRVRLLLKDGKLERYAQLYMPKQKNLQGLMKGWVVLSGRGNDARHVRGRGQLQIQPAALYELPVLVQIFNVMSFTPDRTAFRYALLDFGIADRQFQFDGIYLDGATVSLRGQGTAGFDGTLNLNFYSMLPRHQLPIPIVNAVVREATRGWVGIEVRGKVETPIAKTKPMPQLDDTLKSFLSALPKLGDPILPPLPPPSTMVPITRSPQ